MSTSHDDSDLARREFLRGAAAMTAGCLVVGKRSDSVDFLFQPPGPNHVMTFDVTQTPMACTVKPPQSGSGCILTVTGNDVVHFKVKTSQQKHHLAVLFIDDTPFLDPSGVGKIWAFQGSEIDEASGIGKNGHIDPKLPDGATFEFLVAVWDGEDDNQKSYTSDPTIIIGRGGSALVTAIAQLSAADRLLQKAAALQTTESQNINNVEVQVAAIIGRLRAQLQKQAK
jgi:hypothetical protein